MNKYMETMNNEKSETNRITMYLSRLDLSLTRSLCAMKMRTDMTQSRCRLSPKPYKVSFWMEAERASRHLTCFHRLTSLCSNHRHSLNPPTIRKVEKNCPRLAKKCTATPNC